MKINIYIYYKCQLVLVKDQLVGIENLIKGYRVQEEHEQEESLVKG